MGKVINQHYVPQAYLLRFANENERICVYSIKKKELLNRQNPRNFAAKRFFYDVQNKQALLDLLSQTIELYPEYADLIDFSDEQLIEKYLSRIEGGYECAISEVIECPSALFKSENQIKIIIYLHCLAYRTEELRNFLQYINEATKEHVLKMGIADKQFLSQFDLDNAKYEQLQALTEIGPLLRTAEMMLENYDWYVGDNSTGLKFITSDNPAQNIFLGYNDICFPISSNKALVFKMKNPAVPFLTNDPISNNVVTLSEKSVFISNAFQGTHAYRYLFGDKESILNLLNLKKLSGQSFPTKRF